MESKRQINLLSNEPCREDAFEGHSHQAIALQIAKLIKEDNNRHIIGIEGGWGSGKSNLISLVNKSLNGERVYDERFDHAKSKYPFFIYDAWGHQADYQRRAILEELTQDLTIEKRILDSVKWKHKLDSLLAKRRKTTTKEVPRLGFGVVMSVILCFLTPLVVFSVNLIPGEKWWLRLVVSVLPYLIGFIWVVCDRKRSLKKHGQDVSIANILSESILVYKDQIKENETFTTISEKEPSSAEFKAWMDEVDTDLKTQNKSLIIVFDNMDRLPSQKVESLWSSIHSFFSDKTYDNIRVLIPFDRQHIQKAFKHEDSDNESYGNDFINKTFDVVFRVPPPIMTGWQMYMADLWKKAFGEDSDLDSSVTQIYDALCKNHTPRKIIAFINEIATVKMTMGESIPDNYIALFVFGKEAIDKDPIDQLLAPSFLGDLKFEYDKDPNTIKYLSALYYQLPADKALDVVFTKEATNALNSGNADRLHEMMERIDLKPILSNAILKVTEIENATMALSRLDDFYGFADYGDIPTWLRHIWDSLYQKCLSLDVTWDEIKEFHILLFQHIYKESLAENLIKGYLDIADKNWNVKQFVDAIDRLKTNNDIIDRKLKQHKRKVTPKLFLELLKYTQDSYDDYGVSYDKGELDAYLASLEQNAVLSLDVIPSIGIEEGRLPKYEARLQDFISSTRDPDIVKRLFDKLIEVAEKPLDFKNYYTDPSIYNAWSAIGNGENVFRYDLIAMRLARRAGFNSSYGTQFKGVLENYDDNDVKSLSRVIGCYVSFGELLHNSEYYKDYPLACAVVKLQVNEHDGEQKASVMDCLTHFDQTASDYDIDPVSLFSRLSDWSEYLEFNKTKVDSLPSGVIETAGKVDNELSKTIHSECMAYYASLSQDQWKDHMLKMDDTYRIWKLYHPKKYQANFDALKEVLKDYARGVVSKQPDKNIIDEWLSISKELKHSLKGLFNDVSSILKRDSAVNKAKLLFFGDYILEYSDPEKQSDFVQKLIPTEIIDFDVIGFIFNHLENLKNCEVSEEFREKIHHLAESSMKEDQRIDSICQVFGIDRSSSDELSLEGV